MSITRAVGGQRLGSGNKMDVQMHGYERSRSLIQVNEYN